MSAQCRLVLQPRTYRCGTTNNREASEACSSEVARALLTCNTSRMCCYEVEPIDASTWVGEPKFLQNRASSDGSFQSRRDSNHSCKLGQGYDCEYGAFPHLIFVSNYNSFLSRCESSPACYKLLTILTFFLPSAIGLEPPAERGLDLELRPQRPLSPREETPELIAAQIAGAANWRSPTQS